MSSAKMAWTPRSRTAIPGNRGTGQISDPKKFVIREYTDEQICRGVESDRERFSPLVDLSKKRRIAMRIGTNQARFPIAS